MRIMTLVGARPEFVQLAPVSHALRDRHEEIVVHTGQHYDYLMSAQFFQELALPQPVYHLESGSATHAVQIARILEGLEPIVTDVKPDWLLVFGDTNSTLAGALVASKLHIPLGHIEAGLRSFNRRMPEEINRIVVDHLAQRCFCPTDSAAAQLRGEGIVDAVQVVGDVMYDIQIQCEPLIIQRELVLLSFLRVERASYLLVTVHRPVNTDDPYALKGIIDALNAQKLPVIFPVHPRTYQAMQSYGCQFAPHVRLIDPVGYLDMLTLERCAYRIITDSGGVQKQAFFLGVPCITLRDETEWHETVTSGWNTLVGCRTEEILRAIETPVPMGERVNYFGDGHAARRIAESFERS